MAAKRDGRVPMTGMPMTGTPMTGMPAIGAAGALTNALPLDVGWRLNDGAPPHRSARRRRAPWHLFALLLCAFSACGSIAAGAAALSGAPLLGGALFAGTVLALMAALRAAAR